MMDNFIGQEILQNCGDILKILNKTTIQNKSKEYLYEGIFIKYPYTLTFTKSKAVGGQILNPQIEIEEFVNKIWLQNCGDSVRILKKSDKGNGRWDVEFINKPYIVLGRTKQEIKNGSIINPLIEKEEFIGKTFKQNCGDILKVIKKTNQTTKNSKNKLYECEFINHPCKILTRKDKILDGSVDNPQILIDKFVGKEFKQKCQDIFLVKEYLGESKYKGEFLNYPSIVVSRGEHISKGEVDNPNLPWKTKEELEIFIDTHFENKPTLKELAKEIKLSDCYIGQLIIKYNLQNKINYYSTSSNIESEISKYIKNLEIEVEQSNWNILNGQEIDLYIPSMNIGIEFNGNYWYSNLYKDYLYHQKKSLLAQEKGIKLIHIFEYEYDTPYKQLLINNFLKSKLGIFKKKVGARQCEIKELNAKIYEEFCEENHLQGSCGAKIKLGLYFEEELIQVMSFGSPRFNENFNWEIIRECSKQGWCILGGKEKLWKYFLKKYLPKNCISYCDYSKFDGNSYEKLGFKRVRLNKPGFVWYDIDNHKTYWRNPFKNNELKNFNKIYDCGQLVFEWRSN